jgi:anti-sigma-K factor RskA
MSEFQDRDLLAAEYVLGSLEGEEAREAARLMETDPAFAASVRQWEARLAPLAAQVAPVAPPAELWVRIAASTGAANTGAANTGTANIGATTAEVVPLSFRRRLRVWQGSAALALAIAASLAAFIVLRPVAPARVAVLAPISGGVPVLLATEQEGGVLVIQPSGAIAVPSDRDLELWALAKGETRPRSLGVLPAAGRRLVAALAPDTQLLVSLEPRGGSPTGQPTGPVLYGGTITAVN